MNIEILSQYVYFGFYTNFMRFSNKYLAIGGKAY